MDPRSPLHMPLRRSGLAAAQEISKRQKEAKEQALRLAKERPEKRDADMKKIEAFRIKQLVYDIERVTKMLEESGIRDRVAQNTTVVKMKERAKRPEILG